MKNFEEKLVKLGNSLSNQRHLKSISYGLMAIMPLTIFGSIFQLIAALPSIFPFIPAFSSTMNDAILLPYNIAFGLFGIIAVVTIAYFHSRQYKLNQVQAVIISVLAFFIMAVPLNSADSTFLSTYLGSQGIFLAIFVSLVSVEIMRFMDEKNLTIRLPETIPPIVSDTFKAIIPMVTIVGVMYVLSLGCQQLTGQLIPEWIMGLLSPAIGASDSLWFCMLIAFLIALLGFFGVHGFNVLSGLILPILLTNTGLNAEAYAAGEIATKIFTLPMLQMSGVFYWIIPVLFLRGKSERMKAIGKVSLVPSIFNISEPIQYGAPIMFNPILGIPWVVMQTVNMGIIWCAMYFGFIDKAVIMPSANIPMPVFQYLATLDWRAVIAFLIMLIFSYFLWKPFVRVYDKKCLEEEQLAQKKEIKETA